MPATAIYIRDVTKKIERLFQDLVHQEEKIKSLQSITFTSSLSHEMRTPLASLLFFLKHVMAMVPENCSPAYY